MEEEDDSDINSTRFAQSIVDQVNRTDIEAMVQVQRDMLSRYEKTNEMLINFNLLSLSRYEATSQEFKKHTQVLYEMKKDLDNVFRRIRIMKQRLGTMYPEAFSGDNNLNTRSIRALMIHLPHDTIHFDTRHNICSDVYNVMSEDEDGEHIDQKTKKDKKLVDNNSMKVASDKRQHKDQGDGMNDLLIDNVNEHHEENDCYKDANHQDFYVKENIISESLDKLTHLETGDLDSSQNSINGQLTDNG